MRLGPLHPSDADIRQLSALILSPDNADALGFIYSLRTGSGHREAARKIDAKHGSRKAGIPMTGRKTSAKTGAKAAAKTAGTLQFALDL